MFKKKRDGNSINVINEYCNIMSIRHYILNERLGKRLRNRTIKKNTVTILIYKLRKKNQKKQRIDVHICKMFYQRITEERNIERK